MTHFWQRLATAGLVLGCSTALASAETVFKLSHNNPADHPTHISMEFMGKRLSELTDGELSIKVYPNGELGNQRESTELVQNCALEMARSNASELEAFEPLYAAINLPYIFTSADHFNKVISGDTGKKILDASADNGFYGVAYLTEGARSFYGSKPINSPADLEGMKIRVQPSPSAIRMVELLGGSPTPIDWGELYSALQQGVVDGAENNPTALTNARHGEVAKFFSLDEHTIIPSVVIISTCAYEGMTDDQKAALRQAALEAQEFHTKNWDATADAAIEEAQAELGVTINTVDKTPFIEAVMPMHEETAAKSEELGALIEEIKSLSN